jgi:hypothetical protein
MATVPIVPGTATVVLDGSGGGTAKLGPVGTREVWAPAVASFSVSTNVSEAACKIYVGDVPTANNFVDGSLSGSTGDATGRVGGYLIRLGWFVWAVWTGGDAGSVATLNISGMKQV